MSDDTSATRPDDIVAYTFRADNLCPPCTIASLPTAEGEPYDGWALAEGADPTTPEQNLDEIAQAFGIDRGDETTFDSDDFPKVAFRDMVEADETCGRCGLGLADGTPAHIMTARRMGRDAAETAASWLVGELSEADARSILDDVDPAVLDKFTGPNLSGEWADDPTPLMVARDVIGPMDDDGYRHDAPTPEQVDEIADAWTEAADERYSECLSEIADNVVNGTPLTWA